MSETTDRTSIDGLSADSMNSSTSESTSGSAAVRASDSTARNDPPPIVRHFDDVPWETIRWPGETGKMLFHPRPENPTEPNAGLLRFEPGSYHPWHRHDFAQVWYILEGQFEVGGKRYGPGSVFFHQDPHCEEELRTPDGGLMFIVQYPGPTTGKRPIYADRFNMENRKDLREERIDV